MVLVAVTVGYGVAWVHYNAVAVLVASQDGFPFTPQEVAECQAQSGRPRCEIHGPETTMSPENVMVRIYRDPDASDLLVGLAAGAASLVIVGCAAFVIRRLR